MKKYFKIFLALVSINTKLYLEHRSVVLGSAILLLLQLLLSVLFINIYFSLTKTISGWTKEQVFLIYGLYRIFESIYRMFFLRGLQTIPEIVTKGDIDTYLIKPVSSQFLTSLRQVKPFEFITLIPGLYLVFYAINGLHSAFSFWTLLLLFLSGLLGIIIFYGIHFMIATIVFYIGRFGSFADMFYVLTAPLSVPIDFFGKSLSPFLTFIVPLAFIITVPAKIFLGISPESFIFLCLLFAIICLGLSILFWNFSLRRYASASS